MIVEDLLSFIFYQIMYQIMGLIKTREGGRVGGGGITYWNLVMVDVVTRCRMQKPTETHGGGGRMIVKELFDLYFILVNVSENGTFQKKGGKVTYWNLIMAIKHIT